MSTKLYTTDDGSTVNIPDTFDGITQEIKRNSQHITTAMRTGDTEDAEALMHRNGILQDALISLPDDYGTDVATDTATQPVAHTRAEYLSLVHNELAHAEHSQSNDPTGGAGYVTEAARYHLDRARIYIVLAQLAPNSTPSLVK